MIKESIQPKFKMVTTSTRVCYLYNLFEAHLNILNCYKWWLTNLHRISPWDLAGRKKKCKFSKKIYKIKQGTIQDTRLRLPEVRLNKWIILLLGWKDNNNIKICKLLLQLLNSVKIRLNQTKQKAKPEKKKSHKHTKLPAKDWWRIAAIPTCQESKSHR